MLIKRILIAVVIFIAAAVPTAFISAVTLAITEIYLSGHSYTWHKLEAIPGYDVINVIFILATLGAGALAAVGYWRWSMGRAKRIVKNPNSMEN